MKVVGWDIGGANIKAVFIEVLGGHITTRRVDVKYLPLWRVGQQSLPAALKEIYGHVAESDVVDGVGVTVTAELSDVFKSKREGVKYVLRCVETVSGQVEPLVVDYTGGLLSVEEALKNHLRVSGANWAATATVLAKRFKECILIDVGSSTTDIIPILNHKVAAEGLTDVRRLATGELVYTGVLRSSIPSITHTIPVKGEATGVSSELFALSADVHLLLRNISGSEYTTETADSRGRSRKACLSRLARVVCADPDMIGEPEIIRMASYIYGKQVEKIGGGLEKVLNRLALKDVGRLPVVTTGLGGRFLGREAASKLGFRRFLDLGEILPMKDSQVAAAFSTALLIASAKGEEVT